MNRQELEEIIGPASMMDYDDVLDESERKKIEEWARTLRSLDDEAFREETYKHILEALQASSRSEPWHPAHCLASACSFEAQRRHQLAGHTEDCRGTNVYVQALDRARKAYGFEAEQLRACTCNSPRPA